MPVSPDVGNYHIGKGVVSWKETGGTDFVDLGNAPSFIWTPTTTKKEHFSSREGVKTKDFTAVTQVGATVKMVLDEITAENLALFTLGVKGTNVGGDTTVAPFQSAEKTGILQVVGTNDIGQQVDFTGTVSFVPSGDFKFISDTDEFSVLEMEAEVQKDVDGNFGLFTVRDGTPAGP